ncbi:Crp/Fnr family transcriptional regulator [Clostridium perfringens]|uniref:Crp/Fnr family transcriptional regulator n=1 Tax=Clostridium perfringens TaxID=1502 RepID=UPI000B390EF1|nr:Crp/Fnr family transcriptional regulator [Clostridium perfringens]EHK2401138.1 Crp/Fnr family transcriptional regulator [Clostridium perfringens]MBO3328652.1 Crp/Fnr family transcriptional regulator [Clostridium perfringens]MDK0785541.1 Crp/Fnr family transcriptional regulator [Clostridium perfringens]MDK0847083.1 Crp/Fnr family transcriptional regulator [Clostridium perfringens]MDT9331055.1 Crp/Fnr family transcriptional regulator [Clostridium perfringens]
MEKTCTCESCKELCAKNISIFSTLSNEELLKIVDMTEHKSFKENDVLCREGEKSDKLFLIREGRVKICKITKEGKEQIVYVLSKGDFFGENNIFTSNNISNFSAYAIIDVKLCILKKENLEKILIKNPEISLKIIQEMADRINSAENLAQTLATRDVEARLATVLIEFMNKYGQKKEEEIYINLPLNREQIANYCGITRETVSRRLSKFDKLGIIKLQGNKGLIIKDKEALLSLAE